MTIAYILTGGNLLKYMKLRKDLKFLFNLKTGQMHRLDDMGILFVEEIQNKNIGEAVCKISKQIGVK